MLTMIKILTLLVFLLFHTNAFALTEKEIQEAYYKSYNYEQIQDYENAIKVLSLILKKYPDGYTANLRLGWLYYLNKNYANCIHHYKNAMKTAPYSVEAKFGYTLPLMAQGKYEEVESITSKILNNDYYNFYANLRFAYALRMQKKFELAEKVTNKMLALYPTDISFLTELAEIKDARGKKESAAATFRDILILDPENTKANGYLRK